MNDRSKYPINGVCRFENFADHTANGIYPHIPIGSLAGVDEWFMSWTMDGAMVYPYIHSYRRDKTERCALTYCFQVINKDSERSSETISNFKIKLNPGHVAAGYRMRLLDILNLKEGWIDEHGTVTVEYGFLCESIERKDSIWNFNFHDGMCEKKSMIPRLRASRRSLGAHRQILKFHRPDLNSEKTIVVWQADYKTEEQCLQVAHGVQLRFHEHEILSIMHIALKSRNSNVLKYCEKQLLVENWMLSRDKYENFRFATYWELRRYTARLIASLTSTKELVQIIERFGWGVFLNGEAMKKCVKFFMEDQSLA